MISRNIYFIGIALLVINTFPGMPFLTDLLKINLFNIPFIAIVGLIVAYYTWLVYKRRFG